MNGVEWTVLDNSNIVESYPGITLPLTYSFIRTAYRGVFRGAVGSCIKDEAILAKFDDIFDNMIQSYNGRIYYFYGGVRSLSVSLLNRGLYGKKILLYGKNSYNWMTVFLAVITYVGVIVPIDKEWKRNDIYNVLSDLDISFLFYSGCLKDNLAGIRTPMSNLEDETAQLIQASRVPGVKPEVQNPERVCAVFYTSGTTSKPKKVELTEKNLVANSEDMEKLVSVSTYDRYMLSLPLSHIGTVIGNFVYPIAMGASFYIPDDFKEIAEDLKLIRPTILYGVPRIFEKIWEAVPNKSKVKRAVRVSNLLRKIGIDIRGRLFAQLHENLGGAVRFAYCGAAKLDDAIIRVFNDIGLIIMQAYGMTETAAIISCDSINSYKLGSAGKALLSQTCKIIEKDAGGIGEICVMGDNVAVCALSADGFLHTGDLGYIDKDGYLFITGRKKRLIKLANAKNVYPDELEELLLKNRDVLQALVYENDKRVAAVITSNADPDIIQDFVNNLNKNLPYYKQIRNITIAKGDGDIQ